MKDGYRKSLLALALCLPMMGCGAVQSTTPPAALAPGAVNQFDQDSYKALMVVQASLNSLKSSVATDPNAASLKIPLNKAIVDYNDADTAWQIYHATATSANQAAVTSALNKVNGDVTSLQKAVQ